jgi:hypothetical protein
MKSELFIYIFLFLNISTFCLLTEEDIIDLKDEAKDPQVQMIKIYIIFQFYTQMTFMALFIQKKCFCQIMNHIL